jgi:hypothetical protein
MVGNYYQCKFMLALGDLSPIHSVYNSFKKVFINDFARMQEIGIKAYL